MNAVLGDVLQEFLVAVAIRNKISYLLYRHFLLYRKHPAFQNFNIFIPEALTINGNENVVMANQLAFVPKWGIRRIYGSHFTFEVGFGVGPQIVWGKDVEHITEKQDVFIDGTLRFGYTF